MDDNISSILEGYLNQSINRDVTTLYKNFLIILEDLREKRFVVDEETYQHLRKKVLRLGNECARSILEDFNKVEISGLKNQQDIIDKKV